MIDPVSLLSDLIRADTTNPPGNEVAAVEVIEEALGRAGIASQRISLDDSRPNLVVRLAGAGSAPPLLLHGHLDVVGAGDQGWARDPFGGEVLDGWVWGRGALDMKGPVAMMVAAVARMVETGTQPAGDIVVCFVADEEDGGRFGAGHLVESHPGLFEGVRWAIGEMGAFPFSFDGVRFYPIQVSERIGVGFHVTFRGTPGHGSRPVRGGSMARLGRALVRLDSRRLPVHVTPATRLMLEAMLPHVGTPAALVLRRLLDERTADVTLRLLDARLSDIDALMRNTVSPTVVRGGSERNVVPAETHLTLDGRMLPGLSPADMADEVRRLLGIDADIRFEHEPSGIPAAPDLGLFEQLADAVRRMDPAGVPIPYMSPAVTDARWFSTLGIQCYGFTPLPIPDDVAFLSMFHGEDERVPVTALRAGVDAYADLLTRYGR